MNPKKLQRTHLARSVALALSATAFFPAFAQDTDSDSEEQATRQNTEDLVEEVVVLGIRGSLTSSMNVKRESYGVVDAITAEDIGDFPDTNLAESLQRITGVSIDRSIGEGSRVTVRGVGPDFNLVTLNGRQMPTSSIQDTSASNSRAFDFANLAAEAVSAVEVYKTSRASVPTGGIGATINIKTARPLDNPGLKTNLGVSAMFDESTEFGDTATPEISGIYSNTFADDKWGIAITGSYQDRNLGFNQASVPNGWRAFRGDENNWGTVPQPGTPGSENITNRPDANDVYSVPQNLLYSFNEVQRERTNGQLALQYRPMDNVTATLDYTYSENKIATQRSELSAWFNFGPSVTSWTDGPAAAPLVYSEVIEPATSDIAMGGAEFAARNQNNSVGFNVEWDVSDRLGFMFDYHDSSAESGADSPFGSNAVIGTAAFVRGTTTVDFSGDFPILSIDLPPGQTALDPSQVITTGSSFRNSYARMDIEQTQVAGYFDVNDQFTLNFGVTATDMDNRTAFSNVQRDTWGGAGSADDYPNDVWQLDSVSRYFDNFGGANDPALFDQFFRWDFQTVRDLAAAANGGDAGFLASDDFTTDRRTNEESTAAFLQADYYFNIGGRPAALVAGLRYEETDVFSSALVPTATEILWVANNEFAVQFSDPSFTELSGSYDYVLPSVDFNVEFVDDMILRASYGESIGRPGWGDIQGGQTISQLIRIDGGDGQQGNPGLLPLESENFDISYEWYYGESSYFAIGYFHKDIDNYIGVTQIQATPFNLPHPGQGQWYDEANAATGGGNDLTAIRNYIFTNYADDPAVTITGTDSNGNFTGTIAGIAGQDPVAVFDITIPANQRSATLDGWEVAVQHVFGDSGFGAAVNFTLVDSDIEYDNTSLGEQFAIEGLSDSANVVGFYEKNGWSARVAYNWRDEFLSSRFSASGPNPLYVEDYGQFDVNVAYDWSDNLTFFVEGINVTDETQRVVGRNDREVNFLTETGPRYVLGARYSFR